MRANLPTDKHKRGQGRKHAFHKRGMHDVMYHNAKHNPTQSKGPKVIYLFSSIQNSFILAFYPTFYLAFLLQQIL